MQIVVNWMCRASNLSISQSHGLCTAQTRICAVTMMIIYYIPIGGDNAAVLQTIAKENLIGISTSTRNILITINCYCTVYCGWTLLLLLLNCSPPLLLLRTDTHNKNVQY